MFLYALVCCSERNVFCFRNASEKNNRCSEIQLSLASEMRYCFQLSLYNREYPFLGVWSYLLLINAKKREIERHSHKDLWILYSSRAELPFLSCRTLARSTSQVSSDGLTRWIFTWNESFVLELESASLAMSNTWMKPVDSIKDRGKLLISCSLSINPWRESRVRFLLGI